MDDGLMLGGGNDDRLKNSEVHRFQVVDGNTGEVLGHLSGKVVSEIQFRVGQLYLGNCNKQETFHQLIGEASSVARSQGCQVLWARIGSGEWDLFKTLGFVQVTPWEKEAAECFVLKSLRSLEDVVSEATQINNQRRKVFSKVPERRNDESLWGRAEKFSRIFTKSAGPGS